ncbi:4Fe-4S cluster-binding domain-containing protein [Lachnospiraceae bacterium]|nr:4Fe-4S cluster-binding domain-containing protein [Lachnospiraceae bacterium]
MSKIKELQLGMLSKKWLQTNEIIIYGFGVIARKCVDILIEDFLIPYIIDNAPEKSGTCYNGIPIITQQEALNRGICCPIVIAGTIGVYQNISNMLIKEGLVEYRDFCLLDLFAAEWYWHNKRQVHLVEVHTTITTKCTLKCRNCNMFMPYFKEHMVNNLSVFKKDMDLLFRMADRIFSIGILGGEPLLNKDLADMILYLQENYGKRIGEISIITNGTILPDKRLIDVFRSCKVQVHISDYTSIVPYHNKLKRFESILLENHIKYRINSSLVWCDFGFPENCFDIPDVRNHMMECFPVFRGINDSKLYFCHVAWGAEKCGLYQLNNNDYYNLENIDTEDDLEKERFLNYSLGGKQDWSLSFCKICGGCGADNTNYVPAGRQMKGDYANEGHI